MPFIRAAIFLLLLSMGFSACDKYRWAFLHTGDYIFTITEDSWRLNIGTTHESYTKTGRIEKVKFRTVRIDFGNGDAPIDRKLDEEGNIISTDSSDKGWFDGKTFHYERHLSGLSASSDFVATGVKQ